VVPVVEEGEEEGGGGVESVVGEGNAVGVVHEEGAQDQGMEA